MRKEIRSSLKDCVLDVIDKLLTHELRCPCDAVRRAINKMLYELDPETREFLADEGPEYIP